MELDHQDGASRRAVVLGGIGALAGIVASAFGQVGRVEAANGNTVKVGGSFSGTGTTKITSTGGTALSGANTGGSAKAGVSGSSSTGQGIGVMGTVTGASAVGVKGTATSGTGGRFKATTGTALDVQGVVKFSSAGIAPFAAGNAAVHVLPGVPITATSRILATLTTDPGAIVLTWVERKLDDGSFFVHLSGPAPSGLEVSYLVIG